MLGNVSLEDILLRSRRAVRHANLPGRWSAFASGSFWLLASSLTPPRDKSWICSSQPTRLRKIATLRELCTCEKSAWTRSVKGKIRVRRAVGRSVTADAGFLRRVSGDLNADSPNKAGSLQDKKPTFKSSEDSPQAPNGLVWLGLARTERRALRVASRFSSISRLFLTPCLQNPHFSTQRTDVHEIYVTPEQCYRAWTHSLLATKY